MNAIWFVQDEHQVFVGLSCVVRVCGFDGYTLFLFDYVGHTRKSFLNLHFIFLQLFRIFSS